MRSEAWRIVVAIVATLGMGWLGEPLRGEITPLGVVDLELAATPPRAAEILEIWSSRPGLTEVARRSVWIDFGYLVVYAAAIDATCRVWGGALTRHAERVGRAQWGAAGLDAVENVLLLWMLGGHAAPWAPPLTAALAGLKFLLVAVGLVVGLGGLLVSARPGRGGEPTAAG